MGGVRRVVPAVFSSPTLPVWRDHTVPLPGFCLGDGQPLTDATVRLRPEVLGNAASTEEESFSNGLLEHPQYTRPAEWKGHGIPEVLTSGHHGKIAQWRHDEAEQLTQARRADLWDAYLSVKEGKESS